MRCVRSSEEVRVLLIVLIGFAVGAAVFVSLIAIGYYTASDRSMVWKVPPGTVITIEIK